MTTLLIVAPLAPPENENLAATASIAAKAICLASGVLAATLTVAGPVPVVGVVGVVGVVQFGSCSRADKTCAGS